jgi:methionyl-tRNA formyltransferase
MAGDEVTGASTFLLEAGLDTGPVYGVMTETVRPTDTSGDLLHRLSVGGAGLLVATLDGIEDGTLEAKPQPAEGISLAPKIEVEDARVVWTRPAVAIDRLVRGCTPAPGAWSTFRGERVKLGPLTVVEGELPGGLAAPNDPGELLVTKNSRVCRDRSPPRSSLGLVRAHGKKEMAAADWARGVRIEPGERLGEDG